MMIVATMIKSFLARFRYLSEKTAVFERDKYSMRLLEDFLDTVDSEEIVHTDVTTA
jgi:hypothetical protein